MTRMRTIAHILEGVAILFAIPAMIYLQYRRAKWYSDQKDEKANIQTLFSGEK